MTKNKRTRDTPEQIVKKLSNAHAMLSMGKELAAVLQPLEIYHRWRTQYSGRKVREAKRLKTLEEINRKLKKIVAEQQLDIKMLKHVSQGN